MFVSPLGSALPPALAAFTRETAARGAAPHPTVALSTKVPGLEPVTLDLGGAYTITTHPGPVMRFSTAPKLGGSVDTTA